MVTESGSMLRPQGELDPDSTLKEKLDSDPDIGPRKQSGSGANFTVS